MNRRNGKRRNERSPLLPIPVIPMLPIFRREGGRPDAGLSLQPDGDLLRTFRRRHPATWVQAMLVIAIMKFPHIHRPKVDLQSVTVQTVIELAIGSVLIVMLMRWVQS